MPTVYTFIFCSSRYTKVGLRSTKRYKLITTTGGLLPHLNRERTKKKIHFNSIRTTLSTPPYLCFGITPGDRREGVQKTHYERYKNMFF